MARSQPGYIAKAKQLFGENKLPFKDLEKRKNIIRIILQIGTKKISRKFLKQTEIIKIRNVKSGLFTKVLWHV